MRTASRRLKGSLVVLVLLLGLAWSAPLGAWAQLVEDTVLSWVSQEHHGNHHNKTEVPLVAREPLSGVPCSAGFAGPYPCHNVDLLAFLPLNTMLGSTGSDMWGWTDPETGKEYAIATQATSVAFVDISEPTLPVLVGVLPAPAPNVLWRDVKIYNNHAYIVGDGNDFGPTPGHGLQIFDLTQLRKVSVTPATLSQTALFTGFTNAHNIAINEESGYAYVVGSSRCGGGLYILDLQNPASPQEAGCFDADGYTHDVQCVIYRGPDADYQGHEICFAANEDTLTIVDVTDKSSPQMLARRGYQGVGYTHQGWLTEDQAYFVLGDELDESNQIDSLPKTHSYLWNVTDLNSPAHIGTYLGSTTAIDHNLYIRDGFVYESNYTSGLRILDSSEIGQGRLAEVAYFDTHPASDATVYGGTWSSYIYFASGVVAINNLEDGLYLVKPNLPAPPLRAGSASGGGWLSTGDGQKQSFEFAARKTDAGASGSLSLTDNAAGVSIELSEVTRLGNISGACGSITAGALSLELRGRGTFNGAPAEFKVCLQDTHDPGKGLDRFYLECSSGCSYSTRGEDAVIDGGNVQVKRER